MDSAINLDNLIGDELLNSVVEYAFQHVDALPMLSVPLQTIYFISNFEAEFYNGGIGQFMTNSSGSFCKETSVSFTRIGAHRIAALLAKCAVLDFTSFSDDANNSSAIEEIDYQLHNVYPTNDDGNVGNQLILYLENNRASIF